MGLTFPSRKNFKNTTTPGPFDANLLLKFDLNGVIWKLLPTDTKDGFHFKKLDVDKPFPAFPFHQSNQQQLGEAEKLTMIYIRYLCLFLLYAASVSLATVAEIESLLVFAFSNSSNWDNLANSFPISGGTASAVDVRLKITLISIKLIQN